MFKSLLLGFLGILIVCGFTYFNDHVLHQSFFVGSFLPISVFGGLVLFILLINPLLRRLHKGLALNGKQLAVALVLILAVCGIPGSSFLRLFSNCLVLPFKYERSTPGWKEQKVLEAVPPGMMPDVHSDENTVLNGFVQGLGTGTEHISIKDVPWAAWKEPLLFWIPLVFILWVGLIALSVVLHKQWSEHENLAYPVAGFANSLLSGEGKQGSSVLRNRLFWFGAGIVLFVHLNNFSAAWFPGWIQIPMKFDFSPLAILFPKMVDEWFYSILLAPEIFFTPIAFSFFLASDISFSIGIGPPLWLIVKNIILGYGLLVTVSNGAFQPNDGTFLNFGAYLGIFLIFLYTGRHFYNRVLRSALFLPVREKTTGGSTAAMRVFLFSMALFTIYLSVSGLAWQFAFFYMLSLVLFYAVVSRIVAETGLFYIGVQWAPGVAFLGLFGAKALGPEIVAIMFLLNAVLTVDPSETVMPFIINAFKITSLQKIKAGRMAFFFVGAIMLGLCIAVPLTLYIQYDQGVTSIDMFDTEMAPKYGFDTLVRMKQKLEAQGTLAVSESMSGWERITNIVPKRRFVIDFLIGLFLVLICSVGRFRFTKWPIHPVMFLIWHTWFARMLFISFLAGWLIKVMVTKYGGDTMYRKSKPFMIGLVGGEMLAGILIILIGLAYYLVTGQVPKEFAVLPY